MTKNKKIRSKQHHWTNLYKLFAYPSWNIVYRRKYHYMPHAFNRFKVKGGGIIICNHNHWIEGPLVQYTFVGRTPINLMSIKVLNTKRRKYFFNNMLSTIIVDVENLKWGDFKKIVERINQGELVLIFPEGRVSPPHVLNKFSNGVATLAYITKTPIYPLYMYSDHDWRHRQHIMIGKRIDLSKQFHQGDTTTINTMTKTLYKYMASMKNKLEHDIKK